MSKRTKILLLLAIMASVPFGLQLWRNTYGCKLVAVADTVYRMELVRDTSGVGTLPCPAENPSQVSTSIIVLTWITFACASFYSGTLDATDALAANRRAEPNESWLES